MNSEHEEHLRRILAQFNTDARKKYEAGQREHGGRLWTKSGILDNAIEEAIDLVVYLYTLKEQAMNTGDKASRANKGGAVMRLGYVAGPFRGPNAWVIEGNIRRAEALALEVWKLGCACVCPHTNTRFFQGAAQDDVWLNGDLEIISRCDFVLMTPDWECSSGARAEHELAKTRQIPIFYDLHTLGQWLTQ